MIDTMILVDIRICHLRFTHIFASKQSQFLCGYLKRLIVLRHWAFPYGFITILRKKEVQGVRRVFCIFLFLCFYGIHIRVIFKKIFWRRPTKKRSKLGGKPIFQQKITSYDFLKKLVSHLMSTIFCLRNFNKKLKTEVKFGFLAWNYLRICLFYTFKKNFNRGKQFWLEAESNLCLIGPNGT